MFVYFKEEDNLLKQAEIFSEMTDDNYPESNFTSLPASKPVRMTGPGEHELHFSFPDAVAASFFAISHHNLSSGASISLQAGASFDSSTFTQALTWNRGAIYSQFTEQTWRYWKLVVTDDESNEDGFVELSLGLLGSESTLSFAYKEGWTEGDVAFNLRSSNEAASPLVREINRRQVLQIGFRLKKRSQGDTLRSLWIDLNRDAGALFVIPDTDVYNGFLGRFSEDHSRTFPLAKALTGDEDMQNVTFGFVEDSPGIRSVKKLPVVKTADIPRDATFTRASTAWYKNRNLELVEAAANELRDEHYLSGGVKGILLEPSRTNDWTRSTELDDVAWGQTGLSGVTANATDEPKVTPAGVADKLVEDTSTGGHLLSRSLVAPSDNTLQSLSVFLKAAERSEVRITTRSKANNTIDSFVDLSTGALGTTGHSLIAVEKYADDWWRVLVAFDSGTGGTSAAGFVYLSSGSETISYAGDGSSGAYIWQFQLEEDEPWPSSVIETTDSTVTRSEDVLVVPFDFKTQPMTVYVKTVDVGVFAADGSSWFADIFGPPFIVMQHNGSAGTFAFAFSEDGPESTTRSVTHSTSHGDIIELLGTIDPGGNAQIFLESEGTTDSSTEDLGGELYQDTVNDLYIGSRQDGTQSQVPLLIQRLDLVRGVQDFERMRKL